MLVFVFLKTVGVGQGGAWAWTDWGGGTAVYKEGERTGGGDPLASASPQLPNSEQLVLMRAVSEVDQLPLSKWVKITPSL